MDQNQVKFRNREKAPPIFCIGKYGTEADKWILPELALSALPDWEVCMMHNVSTAEGLITVTERDEAEESDLPDEGAAKTPHPSHEEPIQARLLISWTAEKSGKT